MTTFLGLEVEHMDERISLHLDTFIVEEYHQIHKTFIKSKSVPRSLGLVLNKEDCPELPDPIASGSWDHMDMMDLYRYL